MSWQEVRVADVVSRSFSGPSPTCEERNIRGDEWGVLKTTCSTWDYGWDATKHKVLPFEYWGKTHLEVHVGDSIITKAGPRHRVSVPSFVRSVPSRIVPSGKMICLRPDPRKVEPGFLALALADRRTQSYLDQRTTGMAESQVNFENADLLGAPLWLPSLEAQREILRPLDDAHDLISKWELVIGKKQMIKQGMMQQFLTGRARLPGFTSPWMRKRLGDVLSVRHGRSQKAVETQSGSIPILATGGQLGWASRPLYGKPSVLIGRKGTIDRPQFEDRPFWTVDTLFYTEISEAVDPRYLYYVFLMVDWRSMNEASGVPSLSSSRVEGVEVTLPELPEQVAVRELLDDANAEIVRLEACRAKARDIRIGMTQQLLTDHTRLPLEVAS